MKVIAIIPARGGSKRIPKKNIVDFNGKPMIAWTIEAALKSKKFDRVLVSTDSEEISNIAKQYGAEVPFFRKQHADDMASVSEATVAALIQSEMYWKEKYDVVVQLMPNCPIRNENSICSCLEKFNNISSDYLISAFKFGWMNPWWATKLDVSGHPSPLFPEALKQRSQDLEDLYCPSGAIWIATSDKLKNNRNFYGDDYAFSVIPWMHAMDIDDNDDLLMAKSVATVLKSSDKKLAINQVENISL